MSIYNGFLFFWVGMAVIKWVIVLATVIETTVKYNEIKLNVSTAIVDLLLGTIISSVVILFLWPKYLYKEKWKYFVYPDRKIQHFLIKLFVVRKKRAEIEAQK